MASTLDTYMPYDSGPGSNVTEDGWRAFAKFFRGDGVIRNELNQFAVFGDSTGMQVKVPSGRCWIQGQYGSNSNQTILPIAAAHATLGRRDLTVLRNRFIDNRIELDVLTGTPASTPAYPSLTQNTSIWEIQVGKVVVDPAVVTIAAGKVTALQTYVDGSCRYVVDSGLQNIPTGANTLIDWDISQFDSSAVGRVGSNGLNQFQLLRSGMWMIQANIFYSSNANGTRHLWVARNGEEDTNRLGWDWNRGDPGLGAPVNICAVDRFNANDVIGVVAFQDSGSTLQAQNLRNGTNVALYWLGP